MRPRQPAVGGGAPPPHPAGVAGAMLHPALLNRYSAAPGSQEPGGAGR